MLKVTRWSGANQDLNISPSRVQAQTLFQQTRLPRLFPHVASVCSHRQGSWVEQEISENLPVPKFYETSSHVPAYKFMWPLDLGHLPRLML